jgi:transposase
VIDGILHRIRTGAHWRDLPERFGPWKTVYERHRLWSADGTWEYLLQQIRAAADADGEAGWDISAGSTAVRAHQHAAGARIAPPAPVPEGGRRRSSPAELVRPPGGGGAGGEGLGRSRGGFTARIHLSADGRCRPLSLLITEGQRADCTQFEAVLDKIRVPRPGRKPGSVAADKAYSNSLIRRYLRRGGISHTIPEKSGSQAARRRKGSRGDTLPVHHHAERRILRIRPRRDCEHLARTHPVIRRPRPGPQAQQGIRLAAHIGPGPRSVPWMPD